MTLACLLVTLTACGSGNHQADVCSNKDGALSESAFIFVQSPRNGERVQAGFRVAGCSNTFEATLSWRLLARDGRQLASGVAEGGTLGPGPFAFDVAYSVAKRQVGNLEIAGASGTSDEGFPAPKEIVSLVLLP